jgi:Uma2 family endonuclease
MRAMQSPTTARYVTAEELEAMGERALRSELWDGVVCAREPATAWHGHIGRQVSALLAAHVVPLHLGWVLDSSAGFLLARNPDRVLEPDVSFVSFARLPVLPKRGFPFVAPDLVVEVRSPDSTWADCFAKGAIWIGHGVRVVWLIDADRRQGAVLRHGTGPIVVTERGSLDASPALDLRVPLAEVLRGVP